MPNKGDIYLGVYGSEVLITPFGRKLTEADDKLKRSGYTADGTLCEDRINTKHNKILNYSLLGGDDLDTILTLYNLDTVLSLQIYHTDDEGGTTAGSEINYDQYYVIMDALTRTRELLASDGLWADVKIVLKEV